MLSLLHLPFRQCDGHGFFWLHVWFFLAYQRFTLLFCSAFPLPGTSQCRFPLFALRCSGVTGWRWFEGVASWVCFVSSVLLIAFLHCWPVTVGTVRFLFAEARLCCLISQMVARSMTFVSLNSWRNQLASVNLFRCPLLYHAWTFPAFPDWKLSSVELRMNFSFIVLLQLSWHHVTHNLHNMHATFVFSPELSLHYSRVSINFGIPSTKAVDVSPLFATNSVATRGIREMAFSSREHVDEEFIWFCPSWRATHVLTNGNRVSPYLLIGYLISILRKGTSKTT